MNIPLDWDKITDGVPEFSFKDTTKEAKVVSVYDGDTVKVVFPLQEKLYKWNCRLAGVDTPELRTRNKLEKTHGYLVRDKLREKILNKVVIIKCFEFDKYGRLLISIYCDDDKLSINQWLIDNDYAFKYDGGTKKDWGEYLAFKK
tara:strand:- start:7817 stop:8251 length:435 start_codon:yes stop_codon:yes gene_type:complete